MTSDQIGDATKRILFMAPNEWNKEIKRFGPGDSREVAEFLTRICIQASLLSCYIEYLIEGVGHEASVKKANKVKVRVRKALGITYPERSIFTFDEEK